MAMASSPVVKTLYRSLLRLSKDFDARPATKLLIHLFPLRKEPDVVEAYYYACLTEFLGGHKRELLSPDRDVEMREMVRKHFHAPMDVGVQSIRIDAAFLALRELSYTWNTAVEHGMSEAQPTPTESETDASAQSVHVVEEKKHPSTLNLPLRRARDLGSGVLLVAHPMMYDPLFRRSVILLYDHSKETGGIGLILNKTTGFDLEFLVRGGMDETFYKAFGRNRVRQGGPVPRLQMLHQVESVGGVMLKGYKASSKDAVYAGGEASKAKELVLSGDVQADAFKFFVGTCTWTPGQLEDEIERGCWLTIQAPPIVSLDYRPNLWTEVLQKIGGRFERLALLPEGAATRVVGPGGVRW